MKKLKSLLWIQTIALGLFIAGCESFGGGGIGKSADISKLEGDWIRVESNNPSSDFMKIRMAGTTGTITDKAGSGFVVGDEKWSLITAGDEKDVYPYQELGSDYNYYDAVITLVNDDEISITVGSSGAGNAQKWVRDDGSIVPTVGETLSCSITSATTLTNGPAAIDYIVPCVVDITDELIIEPGTVIEFEENAGFGVYDGGTINAVGTVDQPILFKGKQNTQGYWRGIHIETNSLNNRFENVNIQDAGANYVYCCNEVASVFLKGGKLALNGVMISNGGAHGIFANASAEFSEYSNVSVTSHQETPLLFAPNALQYLDGNGSDYSGNDKDFVEVSGGGFSAEASIKALNVPYLFDGSVMDITEAIVLEAGVEIVMQENAGLGVYDNGALKMSGTASNPVIIRGKEAVSGYWRGIHIETNSLNNQISYAQISDAGANYVYCCNDKATIFLKDGKLALDHTTLSNGDGYGLLVRDDAELRDYSANMVTTHSNYPLFIAAEKAGQLDGTVSDYSGNIGNKDFVAIFNSNIDVPTTFPKNNVPYLIISNSVIDVKDALKLDPGVDMVFAGEAGIGVYDSGTLNAEGTSNEIIYFRGLENQVGYWRGIHTETNSSSNKLVNVHLSNAGSNYVYCCNEEAALMVKSGTMDVSNSYIHDNGGCGIFVKAGATLTENGNTFVNNTNGHICN